MNAVEYWPYLVRVVTRTDRKFITSHSFREAGAAFEYAADLRAQGLYGFEAIRRHDGLVLDRDGAGS